MSEIFIPLPSKQYIPLYLEQNFDGFLRGIDKFSSNFNCLYKLDELKEIINDLKDNNLKLYVSFDRLYFNNEIDELKETITELLKLDITGICYTDIGLLNILNELNTDKEILWLSNHIGTNSKTINFLNKKGVNNVLLSNEITKDEIIKIKSNTNKNIKIGVQLYGFLNMATSSRKLLTNYFEYIDKKKEKDSYYMKDKVKKGTYKVVEGFNTNFYTGKVLNGIKFYPEFINNNIDFIVLDDYMLNENNFYNIIEAFSSLRRAHNDPVFVDNLEKVVDANTYYGTFYGFLDKKTVYRVEDYE